MVERASSVYNQLIQRLQDQQRLDITTLPDSDESIERDVTNQLASLLEGKDDQLSKRIKEELFSWGPVTPLINKKGINEILINGHNKIWIEENGQLKEHSDHFLSKTSYHNFIHRVSQWANIQVNQNIPCGDGAWKNFRVHIITPPLTPGDPVVSLRRHPENPWTLAQLVAHNWSDSNKADQCTDLIKRNFNTLIIGPTGCGKTSVLNALLQCIPTNERVIVIEDAKEIQLPNSASLRLLTRSDIQRQFRDYDALELIRQALRMRPQRLILGEIRGPEAKDFLMALSTGHRGSICTLHADDPHQALLRLEMLVQLGAPQWNIQAIRQLIRLSLDRIILLGFQSEKRVLKGLYQISSLEETGFLLDRL